ncbi:hypothetical protein BS47DRAFT_1490243 [Hydnum rufescens UP504]|uniref:Uncharacterized protein n=1 Tax=Hydnum rufescens UP504 TaxID=1448309 RepID=A0A9P6AE53_9AGAM|nr:hypothetical protein BS47DRAFT_1490243 [Hydnum rufescens UP504]
MRTAKRSLLSLKIFHVVRLAQLPTRNSQQHSFPPIWNRMLAQVARRNGHDDAEAISLPCRCLFSRHQGAIGAALVLAEPNRHAHISSPHGSRDELLCGTMGSGSLAAMAVFESRYSIAGRPPQYLTYIPNRADLTGKRDKSPSYEVLGD